MRVGDVFDGIRGIFEHMGLDSHDDFPLRPYLGDQISSSVSMIPILGSSHPALTLLRGSINTVSFLKKA